MKKEDIEFIQNNVPPPFNTIEKFEEFFRRKLQMHSVLCTTTIATMKQVLALLITEHANRFFCRIDDSHSLKSPESIIEKIRRSQSAYQEKKEKGESLDPPFGVYDFDKKMTDLARFRIVCNFLSDLQKVSDRIKNNEKIKDFFEVDEKETINLHRRTSGERSIKFILEYKSRPGLFIEIQIMTQLQEAWDKKDHYLVYEKRRINPKGVEENFPTYLDSKMFAMAELLYVADNYFDQLRREEEEGEA
jgi:ppGpp synthetase/RelA/SpoT-type nucleotidyltranferase